MKNKKNQKISNFKVHIEKKNVDLYNFCLLDEYPKNILNLKKFKF